MPSSQQIIDDINLRYRNSFTTDQVLVWFNEEQRELFDILELDSPPYTFVTVADENFYPFPEGFDITKIKTVTFQINDTTNPDYIEVPFKRNDDDQYSDLSVWYTVVSDAMFLYVPGDMPDARNVYIYCDSDPEEVTTANLNVSPNLPTKFQELLKLGVLKRIAMARKDTQMKNNYEADYQMKLADVVWNKRLDEPEFVQPVNTNLRPFRSTGWAMERYTPSGF
jgi:hypothetical protein